MPHRARVLARALCTLTGLLGGVLPGASVRAQAPPTAAPPLPTPAALHTHLVPGALRAGVDSFALVIGGATRGWQRITVARDAVGWQLHDAVSLGAAVRQESHMHFDGALRELALRQNGQMGRAPMAIALDWTRGPAGERVRGTATTPSRGGAGPLAIDTAVAPGTVDDNAVLALLPALRWGPTLDVTFPVIASGLGAVSTYRVRVLAADTTTVPAGHFATWRAELQGGTSTVRLHMTQAAPHRLVRAAPVGAPFELQRAR